MRKHNNMLSLLLHTFTSVSLLTVSALLSAVTTETVVGVAGRRVALPCRTEAANQRGVEVCWGRGEPSLFTCHNTVINVNGDHITYRKSYRYSVSSSSSLIISMSRPSDSGFYHCRVQLPGLFNDQTSTVHLIIIPRSVVSDDGDAENLNAPPATTSPTTRDGTEETGSDVTDSTEPMVALVQLPVQQQQVNSLQTFVGNTVRLSFIIFIPALLLTAAYRVWRTNQKPETDRRLNQSEEEEEVTCV
ncbi:hepatitis A virus cellular receptor 1-like isoform X1 [Lates calcarifer]|uniref:Hepatitis A virus cellular receptor 1-like isoform X1 n=2 Tax=Lates calcarifer TaxID=8187 RepID=A0A4W6D2W3_LATCA|nr:hepatitis A virus cellular receptor 1-like isoform X1 [Lates calcarifer]